MFTYKNVPYKIFTLGPKFCWASPECTQLPACLKPLVYNVKLSPLVLVKQVDNRVSKTIMLN